MQHQKQVPIKNYWLNFEHGDEHTSTQRNKSLTPFDQQPLRTWRPIKPKPQFNNISRGSRLSRFSYHEDHNKIVDSGEIMNEAKRLKSES